MTPDVEHKSLSAFARFKPFDLVTDLAVQKIQPVRAGNPERPRAEERDEPGGL